MFDVFLPQAFANSDTCSKPQTFLSVFKKSTFFSFRPFAM